MNQLPTIEAHEGPDGLLAIRSAWQQLTQSGDSWHVWHQFDWMKSALGLLDNAHFFVAKRAGRPVAIFPLQSVTRPYRGVSLRTLELPCHDHLSLSDIICRDAGDARDALAALVRFARNWDMISFPKILEDSVLCELTPTVRLQPRRKCDYLSCRESYDDYLRSLSENFRASLRKARNKATRDQCVVTNRTASKPEEMEDALRVFFELEASGWKGEVGSGTAIKLNPQLSEFYRSLAMSFAAAGCGFIHLMAINGKDAAGQFALTDERSVCLLKIAYDESFARYAPGNLLMEKTLQDARATQPPREVNLMTDSAWHERWNVSSRQVYDGCLFNPNTLRGRAAGLMMATAARLRPYLNKK